MTHSIPRRDDTVDYRKLLLSDTPMVDVRAPVEFKKGSVPGALNLPLMSDSERETVGIAYKTDGQDVAIETGHSLVQGAVKEARVAAWAAFAAEHPEGYLFCMRGGLRSQISQRWMVEAGASYPLVTGGYKALRRFLIEETERLVEALRFVIVAGRTGAGKTDFLGAVPNALDLEGLANHRGSSFGRRVRGQPTQINFENRMSVDLMKLEAAFDCPIFIEDESRRIGIVEVPLVLATKMECAPAILIEEPLKDRVEIIHRDYVVGLAADYEAAFGQEAHKEHGAFLLAALQRIKKRLGGARYADVAALMQEALQIQEKTGSDEAHKAWIETLLTEYYDPMYEYQLGNHERDLLFVGSRAEALHWAPSVLPD
ncbi:MAG: tRNA 2-selenouridine(34) synthase MnmH [Kordiimonadaceae bacterium]|nr:tRNA 2-selenouridine(34) synthase MnmH [Kordiimonadaceae bacterium]